MGEDDRNKAIAIYAIYLFGLFTAVPFVIGVVLAYVFRGESSPAPASHYEHQIGLFWRFLIGNVLNGVLFAIAMPLSAVIIGLPLLLLSGLIFAWLWVMMLTRCVRGISKAGAQEPYPVPAGWSL
ncbi:MAG: hypothetical protein V2I43_18105 [Parvularcula sp.]|nr:hypothetical protein [Parvularcula sp.]